MLTCVFVVFLFVCCFFFNDTATTEIYTLSLHDALPISTSGSPYGGQSVTVTGTGFGSLSNTRVEIGGNPCDVKSIEPTEVICTTRAKPENQKFYPGE